MCASTLPSSSTSTRSFGSPDFACFSTRSSRFSTWSRSATSSSSCRFSRSRAGSAPGEKPSSDDEQCVHLAQVPEQRGPGARHVLHADRGGRDLPRRDDSRQRVEPLVRDLRHADVRLAVLAAAGLGQRREQRRLPRAGQAHDSHLERHARSVPPRGVSSRRCSAPPSSSPRSLSLAAASATTAGARRAPTFNERVAVVRALPADLRAYPAGCLQFAVVMSNNGRFAMATPEVLMPRPVAVERPVPPLRGRRLLHPEEDAAPGRSCTSARMRQRARSASRATWLAVSASRKLRSRRSRRPARASERFVKTIFRTETCSGRHPPRS